MKSSEVGVLIEYNEQGKLSHITDHINYSRYYEYDENGLLIYEKNKGIINDKEDTIQYSYDIKGRIINIKTSKVEWHADSTIKDNILIIEESFVYDDNNTLIGTHIKDDDENYECWKTYDMNGLIIHEKIIDDCGYMKEKYITYDYQGRIIYKHLIDDCGTDNEYWYDYDQSGKAKLIKETKNYK